MRQRLINIDDQGSVSVAWIDLRVRLMFPFSIRCRATIRKLHANEGE